MKLVYQQNQGEVPDVPINWPVIYLGEFPDSYQLATGQISFADEIALNTWKSTQTIPVSPVIPIECTKRQFVLATIQLYGLDHDTILSGIDTIPNIATRKVVKAEYLLANTFERDRMYQFAPIFGLSNAQIDSAFSLAKTFG